MEEPQIAKKKSRAAKVTATQFQFLLSYMESHKAFSTGKFLCSMGKAANDEQWAKLAKQLNCLDGPTKKVEAWKKSITFISYMLFCYYVYQ